MVYSRGDLYDENGEAENCTEKKRTVEEFQLCQGVVLLKPPLFEAVSACDKAAPPSLEPFNSHRLASTSMLY